MDYFSKSKIFLYGMISFIAGIFLGNYFGVFVGAIPLVIKLLYCYIAILLLFISIPKVPKISIILIILFSLGIWRYQMFLPAINENHVEFYNDSGEEFQIEGLVGSEPDVRENVVKIQISHLRLSPEGQANLKDIKGKILLDLPKYTDIKYGDVISFSAKLSEPEETENFSYKNYLARYGVYSIAKNIDNLEILERGKGSWFLTFLYPIKNYFSYIIEKIFPEPHSSFMLGLLIGAKKTLPDWLLEIFRITGITHIIAISGYNISILARIAERTLGRIGRRYIFWGVLSLVILFVLLTGAQASIVRAGIMGGLLVFSGFVGRKNQATNALVFAGAAMIFLNPLILRNDVGFQLSFLATLGLVYLTPVFEKPFAFLPMIIKESLIATLSAQIFVLPVILSTFGVLSLISPLANILILPFIPFAMFLGFVSGALGIVWIPLGQIIGFLGYIILEIIIWISTILSKIPYASLEFRFANWWFLGGYYLIIFLLLFAFRKRIYQNKEIVYLKK